jgi:hypothetical protein
VKKADHCTDALRYAVASAFPMGEFNHPDENITNDQLRKKVFDDNQWGPLGPINEGYF